MSPLLIKKQVILAEVESTYGTDPTPTAADDAILAINPQIKETFTPLERNINISTFSNYPSLSGIRFAELSFQVELKGSGSAGTSPRLGKLLRACGMDETVISATSVTYTPASSGHESATIYNYIDGRRHILSGAYGSFKLTAKSGELAMLEFTFQGLYTAPTATAIVSGTYESTTPPVCKSCSFQYNSKSTLIVDTVELDLGNQIVQRPSLNSSTGLEGFIITGRKPTLMIDPETTIETSYAFRDDVESNQRQVSYQIGSSAGNICTVTVPKFNITSVEYSDRDGVSIEQLSGECTKDSGDDEISLAFT